MGADLIAKLRSVNSEEAPYANPTVKQWCHLAADMIEAAEAELEGHVSAARMTREDIEALGPAASLESREAVLANRGPEPVHEAEAQIAALGRYRASVDRAASMGASQMRTSIGHQNFIAAGRAIAAQKAAEADRDALAERLEKAEKTREEWRWTAHESAKAADALAERVRVLEEALRPFAEAFAHRPNHMAHADYDHETIDDSEAAHRIKQGDLRRAAAALSACGTRWEGGGT